MSAYATAAFDSPKIARVFQPASHLGLKTALGAPDGPRTLKILTPTFADSDATMRWKVSRSHSGKWGPFRCDRLQILAQGQRNLCWAVLDAAGDPMLQRATAGQF